MRKRVDITLTVIVEDEDFTNSARYINELYEAFRLGLEKSLDFYCYIPHGGMTAVVTDG